jgi:hypothetical protein
VAGRAAVPAWYFGRRSSSGSLAHSEDSCDSQNLQGFEHLISDSFTHRPRELADEKREDVVLPDDEADDGDSDVVRRYRQQRIDMILQQKDVCNPSSDGESIAGVGSSEGILDSRKSFDNEKEKTTEKDTRSEKRRLSFIPRDLIEPFRQVEAFLRSIGPSGTSAVKSAPSDHYLPLERHRILTVLCCTKGDVEKGRRVCIRYSELLDRLGLHTISAVDVEPVLSRKCLLLLEKTLAKDNSSILIIRGSRVPPLGSTEHDRKENAIQLIRAALFLIESRRYGGASATETPQRHRDRSLLTPKSEGRTRTSFGSRRSMREQDRREKDRFTILVDIGFMGTSDIQSLASVVLKHCKELLEGSYPIRICNICLFQSQTDPRDPDSTERPQAMSKKMFSGLWKSESESPRPQAKGFAGKIWLNVNLSAIKLKYLSSKMRSRTQFVESLAGYVDLSAIRDELINIHHACPI